MRRSGHVLRRDGRVLLAVRARAAPGPPDGGAVARSGAARPRSAAASPPLLAAGTGRIEDERTLDVGLEPLEGRRLPRRLDDADWPVQVGARIGDHPSRAFVSGDMLPGGSLSGAA